MLHAKNGKDGSQKRGISRQADVGGRNRVRPAQSVNSMAQPVLGDVAVHEGIGGHSGKAKDEKQAQPDRCQGHVQKEAKMLAHQLAHVKNIPQ